MPFSSELVRMGKGKVDPVHQKASPFSSGADDCFELVLENGQIIMQGQSSKTRKCSNNLSPEAAAAENSKLSKLSTVEALANDFAVFAPTFEMGLDSEELVSWFDYTEEPFIHDSCSDFLPELSGVTINNLPSVMKRTSSDDIPLVSHSTSAAANPSISQQTTIPNSMPTAQAKHKSTGTKEMLPHLTHPTSDVCNQRSSTSFHYPSQMTTLKERNHHHHNHNHNHNLSTSTNFSYFSQFATSSHSRNNLVAHSGPLPCSTDKIGNEDKGSNHSGVNPSLGYSQRESKFDAFPSLPPLNVVNESVAPNLLRDPPLPQDDKNAKDDISPKQASRAGTGEEKVPEPTVVASSVCSGNSSIDRTSSSYLKRKFSETSESEGPREEVEEESVDVRKNSNAHMGSKRSRTAQVHNLSERRRRDRINEKMRALQELLPNCNKADKASMLDEAIDYLKTLQLQVQMLSMGARLYMPPMMLPAAMQHGAQMPYYAQMPMSPMGMGIGMQQLNNGMMQMPYIPSPCYTLPSAPSQVPSSSASNQGFAHPTGQLLQMLTSHIPIPGNDTTEHGAGLDVLGLALLPSSNEAALNVGSEVSHKAYNTLY